MKTGITPSQRVRIGFVHRLEGAGFVARAFELAHSRRSSGPHQRAHAHLHVNPVLRVDSYREGN